MANRWQGQTRDWFLIPEGCPSSQVMHSLKEVIWIRFGVLDRREAFGVDFGGGEECEFPTRRMLLYWKLGRREVKV